MSVPALIRHALRHPHPAEHEKILVRYKFTKVMRSDCVSGGVSFEATFTILGSRFSTSWGWKTVMRASVLTALLLPFCPTMSVTSSGLSSK